MAESQAHAASHKAEETKVQISGNFVNNKRLDSAVGQDFVIICPNK